MKSYLPEEAYDNVKQLKKEDKIGKILENNFGDAGKFLKKRTDHIMELVNGVKESLQKVKDIFVSLKNSLKNLLLLVEEHKLMTELNQKHKFSNIMDKFLCGLVNNWSLIQAKFPKDTEDKVKWDKCVKFIEDNFEVQRYIIMNLQPSKSEDVKSPKNTSYYTQTKGSDSDSDSNSNIRTGGNKIKVLLSCGYDHHAGRELFQCRQFLTVIKHSEQRKMIEGKSYCWQCFKKMGKS